MVPSVSAVSTRKKKFSIKFPVVVAVPSAADNPTQNLSRLRFGWGELASAKSAMFADPDTGEPVVPQSVNTPSVIDMVVNLKKTP